MSTGNTPQHLTSTHPSLVSDTPETARFYESFADGLAIPNQDEWLALCQRLERERDAARKALTYCLQTLKTYHTTKPGIMATIRKTESILEAGNFLAQRQRPCTHG